MKKANLILIGSLALSIVLVGCGSKMTSNTVSTKTNSTSNAAQSNANKVQQVGNETVSTSQTNRVKTDSQISNNSNLDGAISNYIINRNISANIYPKSENQFEVHKIYGTQENNGLVNVYMNSFYEGYSFVDGKFKAQGGGLGPVVVTLKKENNKYIGVQYKEPVSGEVEYGKSIQQMFPKEYYQEIKKDETNTSEITAQMKAKIVEWLKSQGKTEAVLEFN